MGVLASMKTPDIDGTRTKSLPARHHPGPQAGPLKCPLRDTGSPGCGFDFVGRLIVLGKEIPDERRGVVLSRPLFLGETSRH